MLVNMTESELRRFLAEYGEVAGLSREEAAQAGKNVRSGRDSARALLKMIPRGKTYGMAERMWTPGEWEWAKKQVRFIRRMSGMRGSYHKLNGKPTRKLLALMLWGHNPLKG